MTAPRDRSAPRSDRSAPSAEPVVVVSGAAGTLGRAIANELAKRGASLVLLDRDGSGIEKLARDLEPAARAEAIRADLTTWDELESAVVAATNVFGGADVVVNSIGTEGPVGPVEELPLAEVMRSYEINVFSVLRLMQLFIAHFKGRDGGRIVNLASGAGLAGTSQMVAYSSSKHAVVGLTRSAAAELASSGIAVNAVCPGCVTSPMMARIEADLGYRAEVGAASGALFASSIPAQRYATPEEVANLVAYLAIDAPSYLTGATLVLDGAMRA